MRSRSVLNKLERQRLRTKLPCWPDASRLTVMLTRDYNQVVYRYFFERAWILFASMFLFPAQADSLLRPFGYDQNFISYFPFLRHLYSKLTSSDAIGPMVSVAYFHFLDVALWLSIILWSSWLIIGLCFLRQYDDFFRQGLSRLAHRMRDRRVAFYVGWILLLSSAFVVTYGTGEDRILQGPEFVFVVRRIPAVYFFIVAILYYYSGLLWAFTIFTFSWKVFRQKWPGVILYGEEVRK